MIIPMDEIAFHSYAGYVGVKILASSLNLNKLIDISTDMVVELMRVEHLPVCGLQHYQA